MPAVGGCLFFLQCQPDFRLQRNFGMDFLVEGQTSDGPFTLKCDEIFIQTEGEGPGERRWAIARQVNKPAELSYGAERPIARVQALINNFDFDSGNEPKNSGVCNSLRVRAAGQTVDFTRRPGYEQIKALLSAGVIDGAPLLTFSFDAWDGAGEAELTDFAHDIAGLCGVVARQFTNLPVVSFIDGDGQVIKQLLGEPLTSQFRERYVLAHLQLDRGLPMLFNECFDTYRETQKSELWVRATNYFKSIHDAIFLEQKFADLMSGLELLIRIQLVESGAASTEKAEAMLLPKLIGAARRKLGWDIPGHYTAHERHRKVRNAVSHGGPLPFSVDQTRRDLDKWSQFFMRRLLMRLGFTGQVRSPHMKTRLWLESTVSDFSEEHNSFEA